MDKMNLVKAQIFRGAKIVGVALGVLLLFILVLKVLPEDKTFARGNDITQLSQEKVNVEKELSLQIRTMLEEKSKLHEMEVKIEDLRKKRIEDLRNKRADLTKRIDSLINPEYKPELDEKKE